MALRVVHGGLGAFGVDCPPLCAPLANLHPPEQPTMASCQPPPPPRITSIRISCTVCLSVCFSSPFHTHPNPHFLSRSHPRIPLVPSLPHGPVQVVSKYLQDSGLQEYLDAQGFNTAGYGCMTCIGNSGELMPGVHEAFEQAGLVCTAVLSGNRNFEARVHPLTAGNYLASPPLVCVYALAGTTNLDITTAPLGKGADGKDVYLKDVWPTAEEIAGLMDKYVTAAAFTSVYSRIKQGNQRWDELATSADKMHFGWDESSTYIHNPPYFASMTAELPEVKPISGAYCLLNFGDSITTDHISPAGVSPVTRQLSLLTRQLSSVTRQLSSVTRQLSLLTRQLSSVTRQLSSVARQLSSVTRQLSSVTRQLSSVTRQLSSVTRQLSSVTRQLSLLTRQLSSVTRQLSLLTRQLSSVTRQLSSVTRQLSSVTRQLSSITRQLSSVARQLSSVARQLSSVTRQLSSVTRQLSSVARQLSSVARQLCLLHDSVLIGGGAQVHTCSNATHTACPTKRQWCAFQEGV